MTSPWLSKNMQRARGTIGIDMQNPAFMQFALEEYSRGIRLTCRILENCKKEMIELHPDIQVAVASALSLAVNNRPLAYMWQDWKTNRDAEPTPPLSPEKEAIKDTVLSKMGLKKP
jgi:hypothetical protein